MYYLGMKIEDLQKYKTTFDQMRICLKVAIL
jgi:hypothetical protein